MRTDARRTHARLIEVATEVFGTHGTEASLNEIAKRANVGPGTLYRHFPSREGLIDACMANWEAQLLEAARRAVAVDREPEALLVHFADDFVRHISVYRGGPTRLLRALPDHEAPWMRRWDILEGATRPVLDRLVELGGPADLPARRVCVLLCALAAAVEDAGLGDDERRALLRVTARGLLGPTDRP